MAELKQRDMSRKAQKTVSNETFSCVCSATSQIPWQSYPLFCIFMTSTDMEISVSSFIALPSNTCVHYLCNSSLI